MMLEVQRVKAGMIAHEEGREGLVIGGAEEVEWEKP